MADAENPSVAELLASPALQTTEQTSEAIPEQVGVLRVAVDSGGVEAIDRSADLERVQARMRNIRAGSTEWIAATSELEALQYKQHAYEQRRDRDRDLERQKRQNLERDIRAVGGQSLAERKQTVADVSLASQVLNHENMDGHTERGYRRAITIPDEVAAKREIGAGLRALNDEGHGIPSPADARALLKSKGADPAWRDRLYGNENTGQRPDQIARSIHAALKAVAFHSYDADDEIY